MLWHLTISLCHNTQLYEYNVHHHSCVCSRALVCCIICTMPLQTLHTHYRTVSATIGHNERHCSILCVRCQTCTAHIVYTMHTAAPHYHFKMDFFPMCLDIFYLVLVFCFQEVACDIHISSLSLRVNTNHYYRRNATTNEILLLLKSIL